MIVITIVVTYIILINCSSDTKWIQAEKIVQSYKQDEFNIIEIYPTKYGGSEWFVNMTYPYNDKTFSINSNPLITKINETENAWFVNISHVRMNVNTTSAESSWKNVEMTGYIKVVSILNKTPGTKQSDYFKNNTSSVEPLIDWRARGWSA